MTENSYIKERVDDQINWYNKKSSLNKNLFILLRSSEIVFSILIPFFAGFIADEMANKYTIGILGVIVAIIAGILSFFKFQENWLQYRSTAERLKNEKYLFLTKTGIYNKDENFSVFVERIENTIINENSAWYEYIKEDKNSPQKNRSVK